MIGVGFRRAWSAGYRGFRVLLYNIFAELTDDWQDDWEAWRFNVLGFQVFARL